MSKTSRARARQRTQGPAVKSWISIGAIVVVAMGVLGAKMGARGPQMPAAVVAAAAPAATPANPAPSASGKQLLFFMNPNGVPCQTQLGILNGVADSLSKVARVVYIKTTEPADLQQFEAYGIRGLPSLVIADANGRELSRFSPGIQSGDAVLAALTR